MIGGHKFFEYVLLIFFSVGADRDTRGTPAQEQCKNSNCANHCSCLNIKPKDCYEILQNGCDDDGVYRIFPHGYRRGLEVYCDQTTDGGGWQVFQRRFNGTLDFRRKWSDYKFGFGNVTGEFWLGNEHVYNILKQKHIHAALRLDLEDTENNTIFAEWETFAMSSDAHSYKVKWERFHGDSGGTMQRYTGRVFSTVDRDHTDHHLPYQMEGTGWWFNFGDSKTQPGVLNGQFAYTPETFKENWMTWNGSNTFLRRTEMKFR